jgi:pyruvate/2-oxoglutarate dehydrogenase complex dihydrolipoamide dehydrogenase (E3) component
MPTAKRLTIETVNLDDEREVDEFDRQVIAAGMERVRAEIQELQQKGLLDRHGKPMLKELPRDMREGADRDFGG